MPAVKVFQFSFKLSHQNIFDEHCRRGFPLHCFNFSLSLFHSRNRIRCAMFFNCLNTFQKFKKKDRIAFYFKPLETHSKILKMLPMVSVRVFQYIHPFGSVIGNFFFSRGSAER